MRLAATPRWLAGPTRDLRLAWGLPMVLAAPWPLLYLLWGAPALALLCLAAIGCASYAYLLIARWQRRPGPVLTVLFHATFLLLAVNVYLTGGLDSPVSFWLFLVPLGATLWLRPRDGAIWLLATLLALATAYSLDRWGSGAPSLLPRRYQAFALYLSLSTFVTIVVAIVTVDDVLRRRALAGEAQAAAALARQLSLERAMVSVSSHFIGLFDLDRAIDRSLAEVGHVSGAGRAYLFLIREDGTHMDNTHEWCAEGVTPEIEQLQDMPLESFPWWMDRLRRGEVIHISDTTLMPAEAAEERAVLEKQSIRSLLVLPVQVGEQLRGFIGFDNVAATGNWSEGDLALLRMAAQAVGSAVERVAAERQMAEQEQRLAAILASVTDAVIVCDAEGRVTMTNGAALSLTGLADGEASGRPFAAVVRLLRQGTGEPLTDLPGQVLAAGATVTVPEPAVLVQANGAERVVHLSGAPIRDRGAPGVVVTVHDVTEQRRLEAEMARASKLEGIGLLAGGIAHDFNNLLAGVLGNISLARADLPRGGEASALLQEAEATAERAAHLTQRLITFARGGAPATTTASLGRAIPRWCDLALGGGACTYDTTIAEGLWPVQIDHEQMEQAVRELLRNAAEAMPGGGKVTVRCDNVTLSPSSDLPLPPGDYVRVAVTDEGVGLAPVQFERIFDPYYTTKPRHSGLGLPTAYSIVKRHGGHIEVESRLGSGSTFRVYLPAAPLARVDEPAATGRDRPRRALVLDEESVGGVAARMLGRLGYEPVLAASATAALELCRRAQEADARFAVVLLDVAAAGEASTAETIERLLELDPSLRIVISAERADDPALRRCQVGAGLVKPYRIDDLRRALARTGVAGPRN